MINEILELQRLQESGAKVTLIEMLPRILPIEDEEVSTEVERAFRKRVKGIREESSAERSAMSDEGWPYARQARVSGPVVPTANWSGREDSNLRPLGPEPSALPG